MNHEINRLIQFALDKEMITKDECDYSVNLLLDLFDENDFEYEEINEHLPLATPILEKMLDHAVTKGLIEDNTTSRDLFDTKIMNCIMPRPHTVNEKFKQKYMVSPKVATDYQLLLIILERVVRIKILFGKSMLNMEILRFLSIYQSRKKIQKKLLKLN